MKDFCITYGLRDIKLLWQRVTIPPHGRAEFYGSATCIIVFFVQSENLIVSKSFGTKELTEHSQNRDCSNSLVLIIKGTALLWQKWWESRSTIILHNKNFVWHSIISTFDTPVKLLQILWSPKSWFLWVMWVTWDWVLFHFSSVELFENRYCR